VNPNYPPNNLIFKILLLAFTVFVAGGDNSLNSL